MWKNKTLEKQTGGFFNMLSGTLGNWVIRAGEVTIRAGQDL